MLVEKPVFGRVWLIESGTGLGHMLSQPQVCISVTPFNLLALEFFKFF
jgi:hypothetical protein